MSAAGLFGLVFNLTGAALLWTVLGYAVEKILTMFNSQLTVFPTFQDVVNGLNVMQIIWGAVMVIIFLALIFNYIMNETNPIPGEQ